MKPSRFALHQGLDDRVLRLPGLQPDPARVLCPAGPAGDLVQHLVGPLERAEVAAGEPEIPLSTTPTSVSRGK